MLYIKEGFPEINEYVYCRVKKIHSNSVFLELEEYGKEGILIISEVSPGRIRNLRDFVVEGKKIVCKVLRVDPKSNRIDVSLRRVPQQAKNSKIEEIKKEEFVEKFYTQSSKVLNMTKEELFEKTYKPIFERFQTLFEGLYYIIRENKQIEIFKDLTKSQQKTFLSLINEKIKPEKFTIKKTFSLFSLGSWGVSDITSTIKNSLPKNKEASQKVSYKAAGKYVLSVTTNDMKKTSICVEKFLSNIKKNLKKGMQLEEI